MVWQLGSCSGTPMILLFFSRSCWIRSLCSALPCLVSAFVFTSSSLLEALHAPSLSRMLRNCCWCLRRTYADTRLVLTGVADSTTRGQAKQNAQLNFLPLPIFLWYPDQHFQGRLHVQQGSLAVADVFYKNCFNKLISNQESIRCPANLKLFL